MHWLRIERFWVGEYPDVRVRFLPVMCQHCHDAPCEPVCPVYASYHNPDGLNGQVYNRCVGTRYCGNNCPYAVRVFNFYNHDWPKPLDSQLSPDITVRPRGVMEKCSFCIQRIRRAKEDAKGEGRLIRDGEVQPACVQTCPAEAMVFGNLAEPRSRVAISGPQPAALSASGEPRHPPLGLLSQGRRTRTCLSRPHSPPKAHAQHQRRDALFAAPPDPPLVRPGLLPRGGGGLGTGSLHLPGDYRHELSPAWTGRSCGESTSSTSSSGSASPIPAPWSQPSCASPRPTGAARSCAAAEAMTVFCYHRGRPVPPDPPGAQLGLLLPDPLSQPARTLAQLPLAAPVGRNGDHDLYHRQHPLSLPGNAPRPGCGPRPFQRLASDTVRDPGHGVARYGPRVADLPARPRP